MLRAKKEAEEKTRKNISGMKEYAKILDKQIGSMQRKEEQSRAMEIESEKELSARMWEEKRYRKECGGCHTVVE